MARIAFFTVEYLPFPGGIANYVYNSAKAMRGLGHDARVYVFGEQGEGDDGASLVPVTRLSRRPYSFWMLRAMSLKMARAMHEAPADLWIAADVACATAMGLLPARPKVAVLHGTEAVGRLLGSLDRLRLYRPLRHFDRLVANSEFTRQLAIDNHAYLADRDFVASPLAVARRERAPRDRDPDAPFSIISVGRKEPRKGLEYAIAALDLLSDDLQGRVVHRIVGRAVDHAYSARIDELAAASRAKVEVLGSVSESELARLYGEADVFLHPSVPMPRAVEGFGLVLLEAAASGIAVVSTLTDAIPEVVKDGETGLLVPPRDPGALADALAGLIADPGRLRAMGDAGVAHAEGFTWERHVAPFLEMV